MKPLRLTMQAFGPYAGRVEVDFRPALDSGLFGIYGPTGSGKSSIFSALTFALFGRPAREEQSAPSLRSDHADADCLTQVELVFALGEKSYLCRRVPEQIRPARRGGGETKETHAAWLFDVTGIPVDEITEVNCGIALAERKTTFVDEAIRRILGYGADQFRQIVLLPQGKFETFLTANTTDRLAILRDLFDVSLYKRLAQKMAEDAKLARDRIRDRRLVHDDRLEQEGFADLDALRDGLEQAGITYAAADLELAGAREAARLAEETLQQAAALEARFIETDNAGTSLAGLEARSGEMTQLASRLKGALAARSLVDADAATAAQGAANAAAMTARGTAATALSIATAAHEQAEQALGRELGGRPERDELERKRAEVLRHRLTLQTAEGLRIRHAEAVRVMQAAQSAFEALARTRAEQLASSQMLDNQVRNAGLADAERARLAAEQVRLRHALQAARAYAAASAGVVTARAGQAAAEAAHASAVTAHADAEARFAAAEAALSGMQALHLAERLHDGEACPVCGSPHHPHPARGTAESGEYDLRFRKARTALIEARTAESQSNARMLASRATLDERSSQLDGLAAPDESPDDLALRDQSLARQISQLGAIVDVDALKALLAELAVKIPHTEAECATSQQQCEARRTELALARQALDLALDSVPEDLRTGHLLDAAVALLEADIGRRQQALDGAQQRERVASETLVGARKDVENAERAAQAAALALDQAKADFLQRLAIHQLTESDYLSCKHDIGDIDRFQEELETYRTTCAAARDRLLRAASVTADLERPDQALCREQRDIAVARRDLAIQQAEAARSGLARMQQLEANLAAERERIDQMEREFLPLGGLADAFSGKNPIRTSLESFAIGAMFEAVLEAANLRLGPMTDGRYGLIREQEPTGAGSRGLGIEVLDSYTGRSRGTATLSGGETFLAALSLALGLSDVVQSSSKGIRLDTIFIDEGFGSLDAESLDRVLQALQDLVGSTRAVGLISHVETVQLAIPNGFRIVTSANGSQVVPKHL